MTSQLNVDTIVDKAGSGGTNVKIDNTSTYVSDGGAVTQNTVQGLAKVWVNFNGSGTLSVRDSLSISSVTDGGTGNFTPNFSNAFNNTNYIGSGTPAAENNHTRGNKGIGIGMAGDGSINNQTTTALQMFSNFGSTSSANGGADDLHACFLVFFGDLA